MSVLNPRQEKFCQGVAQGLRQNEAYRRAEYVIGKSSKVVLNNNVQRLMEKPYIRARINELRQQAAANAQVTTDKVVRELACIAFSNPADFVDDDDQPLTISKLSRAQTAAIQDFTVFESYDTKGRVVSRRYRYKMHDKRAALETLAKHLGMFAPDTNIVNNNLFVSAATVETEALEQALIRAIEARNDGVRISDPMDMKSVLQTPSPVVIDAEPRLVSLPVQTSNSAPPPGEASIEPQAQSTTEAFLEWSKRPPKWG